ncbi:MAG: hypothetical protein HYV07_32345 [Deltaproteobacteria bacterium]|nr:hypothetical protein [Deltaproteobacteria bacterium]
MKAPSTGSGQAFVATLLGIATFGCQEVVTNERKLSSFEVRLEGVVGTPENRCLLPGTPTVGIDLSGCPRYERDAAGATVLRLAFEARAIDTNGELFEELNDLATIKVVPGRVESAFTRVRFENGVAKSDVSFRSSFGDTYLWVVDDQPPSLGDELPLGMNAECNVDSENVCAPFNLACVNTKPAVGADPRGLAYCTAGCSTNEECPSGYFCTGEIVTYSDSAADTSDGACVRKAPTFSSGVAGPIHLVEPTLADVSRSDSLIASPFEENFIQVKRGKLVVTAVRIDGFYVTDLCPIIGKNGATPDEDCNQDELDRLAEFNHLFVFTFGRPTTNPRGDETEDEGSRELLTGDRIRNVAGPMSEFNGLTEMNFPEWEVLFDQSPGEIPAAISLHDPITAHFPRLVEPRQVCAKVGADPETLKLLNCDIAMERVEAARVSVTVDRTKPIPGGSPEADNLERYGQWPVIVKEGTLERTFQIVTRENLPFFDPLTITDRLVGQTVTGNLRQVAFDDRSEPLWIIEPRDQNDCPWCVSP